VNSIETRLVSTQFRVAHQFRDQCLDVAASTLLAFGKGVDTSVDAADTSVRATLY
jgi:hypothetical protein